MSIAADQSARRSLQSLDCAVALLLAAISVNNFVHHAPTAFEWPGTDMAPFYERQQDPQFLPNDYYTNSISQPNPRLVFGYAVVGLARLFHTDWYSIYFAIRVLMTLTVPVLWYLALVGMIEPTLRDDRQPLARAHRSCCCDCARDAAQRKQLVFDRLVATVLDLCRRASGRPVALASGHRHPNSRRQLGPLL